MMSRVPLRFVALSAVLVALNTTGLLWIRHEVHTRQTAPDSPLRVVETLPKSEPDHAERLSVVFDRDAGEPTELNEAVAETPPFRFTPELPGYWEWANPKRLDFVLAKPLPPGRTFQVVPAAGIENQLGKVVQVDAELEFQTRALEFVSATVVASDRTDVTVELKFNQPVAPDELLKHLNLLDPEADDDSSDVSSTSAGQLTVTSLVQKAAETIVIRCPRPQANSLKLIIAEDLTGAEGERPLAKAVRQTLKLSPIFAFLRSDVDAVGMSDFWHVELRFLPGLSDDQTIPHLKIEPPVDDLSVSLRSTWRSNGRVLRLRGRFESGRVYRTILPQSLLSVDGKPLGEDVPVRFEIPDRRPRIAFSDSKGLLSPGGNLELELSSVNVRNIRVSASRVHRNNLVAHLQGESAYRTARSLGDHSMSVPVDRNRTQTHVLRLRDVLGHLDEKSTTGVFQLTADATDQAWTRDWAVVSVSDLGLTLRQSPREIFAWVTSLSTGEPVAGARVESVSYTNQTLSTATTDESGRATLPLDPDHPDGRPWVIIAEQGEQLVWIECDEGHVTFDNVDASGRPTPHGLDVLLYTDRGAYRPGETIRLAGLLRDDAGNLPPRFPIQLHVIRPDGREAGTEMIHPGGDREGELPGGTFHHDFTPEAVASTGPWQFRITLPESDEVLAEKYVFVEEFVPVRLEVKADPSDSLVTDLDDASVTVSARYLFGAAAANLPVQLYASFSPSRFRSKKHPDFNFGPLKLDGEHPVTESTSRLNETGEADLPLRPEDARIGRWSVSAHATVSEEGGRSVSASGRMIVDTFNHHLGLRSSAGPVVTVGTDTRIDWLQLDASDQQAEFQPFNVELLRVDYESVMRRINGRVVWERLEKTSSVWKTAFETPDADRHFSIRMDRPGQYRLIATDRSSGSRTELEIRATDGHGGGLNIATATPERVTLTPDKARYRPGETALVLVETPFSGRLLLTLESNRVLWSQVVELKDASKQVVVPIPGSLRGGAFVSATVLRPIDHTGEKWRPHRARGLTRLMTDHSSDRLIVNLDAPVQAAPSQVVDVQVQTAPHAAVHLWAVDQGILATTDYSTPDPHDHYYGARRHETITSDVFGKLLPDYRRPATLHRIGGDQGSAELLRRNPVPTKHAAPAVVWRTFVTADESGHVKVSTALPDFTGELRWMAVAATERKFGSTEQAMTVTAPLLIEAPWLRFAAPGDSFRVPARIFNSTDAEVSGVVSVGSSSELNIEIHESSVTVPPHDSCIVWIDVVAIESCTFSGTVRFSTDSLHASSKFTVSVRPGTPLVSDRVLATLAAGDSVALPSSRLVLPESARTSLTISSGQSLELEPALSSLIRYPYGCVEQTSSRVRGLLAVRELLRSNDGLPSASRQSAADGLVHAGIARLWAMQSPGGGLSYWLGQAQTHVWGSAYAGETLALARYRGYDIDDRLLLPLRDYLGEVLRRPNTDGPDAGTRADLCLTLARLGEPPIGWMSVLSERLADLDMGARATLALAWLEAGRRDRAVAALPDDTIDLESDTRYAGRFSSPVGQRARLLHTLLQLDPEHPWIPRLRLEIDRGRKNGVWLSTLENAVVIEALAAAERLSPSRPFSGQVTVGDETFDLQPGMTERTELPGAVDAASLEVSASGDGDVYLSLETTGLALTPPEDSDRVIRVRRRWLDRKGEPINPANLRVGDLVLVEVTLKSVGRRAIPNVAIVDALPTGLEIENPRLATSDNSAVSDDADHVQFQDDRVVIFATANRRGRTFRYALRAMTEGDAMLPPVQASCMYDESIASIHGAGRVRIRPIIEREEPARLATRPEENTAGGAAQ